MTYRGGAAFAWQSDYSQFYIFDADRTDIEVPTDITPDMMAARWHRLASGLVVLTDDCLVQVVEIRIFGAEPAADPVEWRSGLAWTRTEHAGATLPSIRFTISSPSKMGTEAYGPTFRVDAPEVAVRIQWLEHGGSRDDGAPGAAPDVIRLDIWPA